VKVAALFILVAVPMPASAYCGKGHPDVAQEPKDSRLKGRPPFRVTPAAGA